MSYNFSVAVLPDLTLSALGVTEPGTSDFDEVVGTFDLKAAQVGPHVALLDPLFGVAALAYARRGDHDVVSVTFGGVSSTYVIQTLHRRRVLSEGDLVEETGDPIPAEAALAGHEFDEDAHVAVVEAVLGTGFDAIFSAQFVTLVPEAEVLTDLS